MDFSLASTVVSQLFPLFLQYADHFQTEIKVVGLQGLQHILEQVNPTPLRSQGVLEVGQEML